MYIEDLKKDFYNVLIGKRILLLVNYDIDAICTCKILQYLFRCDSIIYTLVPVQGITDLQNAYEENCEEIKYVVLVNCGGTIDIVDSLQPEEDVVFFVIDSHKPTDVCNIYNNGQIRLLSKAEDDEGIPEFEEIFQDESEEDDQNCSDDGSGDEDGAEESRQAKRRRLGEEAVLRRRERRLWEEKRDRLMFNYTQFSYYGHSSAVIIFELAWKLSKDNMDLLWWAIVAVTEQILLGKVENYQYVLETGNLQGHVARLGYQGEVLYDENSTHHKTALKITYDKDLNLALYRHWTVEASLRHSMYSAVKLKLWTLRGENKLHELLAEMGLPLVQSRQKFNAMDLVLRQEFHSMIAKLADKYQLHDIVIASFTLQYGFRSRYCAADVVYAMLATLEFTGRGKSPGDCFVDALDCLSRQKKDLLEDGIEKAKRMLMCIFKQVQAALDMHQVISAGPFVYLVLQEGTLDAKMFSRPHCITLLAHFALKAHVASSRNRKASSLPLIASAPHDLDKGTCLIVGIPPTCEDSPKNFFGRAFERAAEKTSARMLPDYFDSSIVELKTEDRTRFFDALTTLLS
ncbi:cell division control protein 45 homolog [Zootermopsis nevadensis]|uniref:CDC45-related protein n=1 Tax=Zootermopsis nevadensis TaxID=136037 RepID=A0A067R9J8_ZOONE|nr:cell division control protein 45 homolog [Zootermopsis nevadensis]KDR16293.1 CDC45-related protein [Zootermopsis nevadensis]